LVSGFQFSVFGFRFVPCSRTTPALKASPGSSEIERDRREPKTENRKPKTGNRALKGRARSTAWQRFGCHAAHLIVARDSNFVSG
jgi:hypothetical protein